jgi:hypothetical protein
MSTAKKEWMAWRVDEQEVRVQIHRADIAKAFCKLNTARLVGYSVGGNYLRMFHIKQPVPWVDAWMKEYIRSVKDGAKRTGHA